MMRSEEAGMGKSISGMGRIAAAAVALVALAGLEVQLEASIGLTGTAVAALAEMLRYFTIIANLLAAFVFGSIALGGRRYATPFALGGVTLALLLVGIVYGLLLNGLLSLSGGALLADTLLHKVTPVLVPLWWLAFAPKGGLKPRDPLLWALLPLAYFGYALARGAMDGRYPYPFMNVAELGVARTLLNAVLMAAGFLLCGALLVWLDRAMAGLTRRMPAPTSGSMEKMDLPEAEWKKRLSPEQYHVLREGGTERAFTGVLYHNHEDGDYRCAACGNELFDSGTKFESGSGWPSFTGPAAADHVTLIEDNSHGMRRTEVRCAKCGGHLGHVFPDGPGPEGLRYCINSAALDFEKRDGGESK
jgi:methionine-R-sulfoxide reductase